MSRKRGITAHALDGRPDEKGRVIACPQAKRGLCASGRGGALITEPSGADIGPLREFVAVRKKHRHVFCAQLLGGIGRLASPLLGPCYGGRVRFFSLGSKAASAFSIGSMSGLAVSDSAKKLDGVSLGRLTYTAPAAVASTAMIIAGMSQRATPQ